VRAESRIAYGHLQPIRATATRDDLIADANAMHGNEGAKTMGSDPNFGGQQGTEEWLTVKEFAALVRMKEHSVREAIRKNRLTYRVESITRGPKGTIRIIVPTRAA
jgi:hypothetical protein